MHLPRIIISGLSGGSGKTMVSLGLARAFSSPASLTAAHAADPEEIPVSARPVPAVVARPPAPTSAAFSTLSGHALALTPAAPFFASPLPLPLRVRAFKKGPDYIDAAWLALAARSPQGNLDPFFTPGQALRHIFNKEAARYDLSLIEGNRGLFDGLDLAGSCSTAELSRLLQAPILLVIDCTKMTRTTAALVAGCLNFEPGLRIGGVILNRTGNKRHRDLARRAVEELAGVPVLGVLPRRHAPFITERHMGLADTAENVDADAHLDALAGFLAANADLAKILELARSAPELPQFVPEDSLPGGSPSAPSRREGFSTSQTPPERSRRDPIFAPEPHGSSRQAASTGLAAREKMSSALSRAGSPPLIGYVLDAAFWFYYHENLMALREAGAELTPVSLLGSSPWPDLDGLYIGGGLPELHAEALAANIERRGRIAELACSGLPIYAECGGFMYLASAIRIADIRYPMAGVFPCDVEFFSRPQGLGYIEAEVMIPNPYHPLGTMFRGHEFHFSRIAGPGNSPCGENAESESTRITRRILRLHRGQGMEASAQGDRFDGMLMANTFASYTHIYAPAAPHWAAGFVSLCARAR